MLILHMEMDFQVELRCEFRLEFHYVHSAWSGLISMEFRCTCGTPCNIAPRTYIMYMYTYMYFSA